MKLSSRQLDNSSTEKFGNWTCSEYSGEFWRVYRHNYTSWTPAQRNPLVSSFLLYYCWDCSRFLQTVADAVHTPPVAREETRVLSASPVPIRHYLHDLHTCTRRQVVAVPKTLFIAGNSLSILQNLFPLRRDISSISSLATSSCDVFRRQLKFVLKIHYARITVALNMQRVRISVTLQTTDVH